MVSSFQTPLKSAHMGSEHTTEASKRGFVGEPKVWLVQNPASSGGSKQLLGEAVQWGQLPVLLPHSTSLHIRDCFSSDLSTAMHEQGDHFPTSLPTSNTVHTLTVPFIPFLTVLCWGPVL